MVDPLTQDPPRPLSLSPVMEQGQTLAPVVPEANVAPKAAWVRRSLAACELLLPPLLTALVVGTLWEMWVRWQDVPAYLVPAPSAVAARLARDPGFFLGASWVTTYEAVGGLLLGSAVALLAAVVMAHSRLLEQSLYPLAILVKVTPIVTVAPLFVIWFGFGIAPKICIAALIAFFPMLVNAITGFRSVHPGALAFLQSLDANRIEVFLKLRLPSSLPYLLAALKVSTTLCVIGAVVAEWIGADKGLGRTIAVAYTNLDMATIFSAIVCLAVIGVALMLLISVVERRILFWHESVLEV